MKTILVDAINGLILEDGAIYGDMYRLLESYPNPKLVLTGANDEQWQKFNLDDCPYEVFTLKHNPEKTDPKYFEIMLAKYNLSKQDVVYFEHSAEVAKIAKSIGIETYLYDHTQQDLVGLKLFFDRVL